jgi:hypothetical protein
MKAKRVSWPLFTTTLADDTNFYVFINNTGSGTVDTAPSDEQTTIPLGRVRTLSGDITALINIPHNSRFLATHLDAFIRDAIGSIYVSGSAVTENAVTDRAVDVTAGRYFFSQLEVLPSGGTEITFRRFYPVAGVYVQGTDDTVVSNTQYSDGTDLQTISAGRYVKHSLYVQGDGANEVYSLVYGRDQFVALVDAEQAPLATPPTYFTDIVVPIAAIIVQQGSTNIVEFIDVRPRIGFQAPSLSVVTDHGNLTGLTDNDHPQYLLRNGGNAMTSTLSLGTNAITNVTTVNGVTVEDHDTRHLPNGADPLVTAAPTAALTPASTNSVGIQNSFSRSDHDHQITGFQPLDSDLTALANTATTGLYAVTATGTSATRTVTAGSSKVTVTNGSGVAGNPTIDAVSNPIVAAVTGPISTPTYVDFNAGVVNPPHAEGRVFYDNVNKTLAYYNDSTDVTLNIGQENYVRVRNVSGSTVTNGQVVYITGVDTGLPTVTLALANAELTSQLIGVMTETVANNANGYCTEFGVVHNFDTSAFATGSLLYLSATTPGSYTLTAPVSPNYVVPVGIVLVSNAATGSLAVVHKTARVGFGTGNQLQGMNAAGTAVEYKTVSAGAGISVTPATNLLTIANTGVTSVTGTTDQTTVSPTAGAAVVGLASNPTIPGTSHVIVPLGTTAQETGTSDGGFRYNTTTSAMRMRTAGAWRSVGTVTSVDATGPASGLSITGVPITGSGTINIALADDLAALEGMSTTGIAIRTGTSTWTARTLVQPGAGITITSPDGITGNPTLVLANDLAAVEGLATTGITVRTGTDTWATRTLSQPSAGVTITNADGAAGNPTFALNNDLAAVEGLATSGLAVRTGTDTWATRTINGPAAGVTVSNGDGVSGNPTIALANDLSALEALASTGIAVRTTSDTWAQRTVVGTTNEIAVTDGSGVAGNPTIALATNPILPGTGSVTVPTGTTAQRPGSPTEGMIRYNTTEDILEGYANPYNLFQTPTAMQHSAELYTKRNTWQDDFVCGTSAGDTVLGLYGQLNWSSTSPSGTSANAFQPAETNHPGILRLVTQNGNGDSVTLHLMPTTTGSVITAAQVEYMAWVIRIPTITTITVQMGLGQNIATATTFGTDGVFFKFDPAANAAWQFITRAGGTSTTVTTGTTVVANTWYLLEMFYNGTTWTPVINAVTQTGSSTNVPTGALNVGTLLITNTNAIRNVDVDMFSMMSREMGARF